MSLSKKLANHFLKRVSSEELSGLVAKFAPQAPDGKGLTSFIQGINSPVNFVQVGANNGIDNDHIHPFYELNSVIFSCAQFALYCGASKLIFVGCDVTNNIRVGEERAHDDYEITKLIQKWAMFKTAVAEYQRQKKRMVTVEVFRPLGLKGLFSEYSVD
jgi:hypothetical protein